MLNLNATLSSREADLPFICVIKGSKRRQHRLPYPDAEYPFVYDKKFRSLGCVELNNVVPEKLNDVVFNGRFSRKMKEELFSWFKKES